MKITYICKCGQKKELISKIDNIEFDAKRKMFQTTEAHFKWNCENCGLTRDISVSTLIKDNSIENPKF